MTTKSDVTVRNGQGLAAEQERVRTVVPPADVYEAPDAFVLMLDMPGAVRERISVAVDRDELVVAAPAEELHGPSATLLAREIEPRRYHRAFALGSGVDRNAVEARYENGVLALRIMKSPEAKRREIAIR